MPQETTNVPENQDNANQAPVANNADATYQLHRVLEEQAREIAALKQSIQQNQQPTQTVKDDDDDDGFDFDFDDAVDKKLPSTDNEDKYENLSKKQLVEVLCDVVEDALKKQQDVVKKDITNSFKPELDKLNNVEQLAMKIVASMGVNDARARFKDFDEYREPMGNILGKYPGMSFNDAYLLAKAQSASNISVPPTKVMETEKPQSNISIPSFDFAKNENTGREASGVVGFRQAMESAINKILK